MLKMYLHWPATASGPVRFVNIDTIWRYNDDLLGAQ
jgi:hypothetical protein